jgi:hypothetical protein
MAAMLVVNQTQNEKDLFRTTHTSFLQFIVPPSFKGEDFLYFSLSESRNLNGDHVFSPIRMSEYVSDCCLMPTQQIFPLYHGENKLIFNEMMMSALN